MFLKTILFVVGCFSVVDGRANLLISKTPLSRFAVENTHYLIEYQFINIGDTAATNVILDDRGSFPTSHFHIEKGSLRVIYEEVPARSNITHVVVIKPRFVGEVESLPANVTFYDGNEYATTQSTAYGKYYVYNTKSFMRFYNSKWQTFGTFSLICLPITLSALLLYMCSVNRYCIEKKSKNI
ncbi:unnamed protein product [Caenorhabditis bovis]|uniref:Translocon-associated protein subunit beta n=1 Tax=Caenorhabditis bovis TaxID=2654633 RepID=A0A8S1EYL8_9PELO|nr:unnamed protein product [Caenorhabditis bovis]